MVILSLPSFLNLYQDDCEAETRIQASRTNGWVHTQEGVEVETGTPLIDGAILSLLQSKIFMLGRLWALVAFGGYWLFFCALSWLFVGLPDFGRFCDETYRCRIVVLG